MVVNALNFFGFDDRTPEIHWGKVDVLKAIALSVAAMFFG
jgi:hypothetical protein